MATYSYNWWEIIYFNGLFISLSDNNIIASSPEGIDWTNRYTALSGLAGIASNGEKLVVINIAGKTLESFDGINWSPSNDLPAITTSNTGWRVIRYYKGKFVAIGGGYGSYAGQATAYSNDGYNWQSGTPLSVHAYWSDLACGNGLFITVSGNGFNSGNTIDVSEDGVKWVGSYLPAATSRCSIAYGNNKCFLS